MKLAFLGGGASHGIISRVAGAAGVEVEGAFGPVGAMRDKLLAGEACDVVALTHAQVAELTAAGRVEPGVIVDLGTVRTSIAVREDRPLPDITTPEALRSALLAAESVHFPDPQKATAGIHFVKVLEALGIHAELRTRLKTYPGGLPAMAAVAADAGNAVGCTQATEILATPGVTLVAPLPAPHGLATVYTAAVSAAAREPGAARAFVTHLGSRDASLWRTQLGFEGAAIRRATRVEEVAIRSLVFGILDEYAIAADPDLTDRDLFDLDAGYYSRGGMFDVAIDPQGSVVASCGTVPTGDSACELRKMYVRRDQRGQGLGQRLLDRALAYARGRGYQHMTLETASVLKEAMAMYEKAGFVRQAHPPEVKRCDRVYALELR